MGATLEIRPPAVAGSFYPRPAEELGRCLDALLEGSPEPRAGLPKALLVPHAGYVYSGPVAAKAYAGLRAARGQFRRVVLVGPSHHVAVPGLALPKARAFDTPLGRIALDEGALEALHALPQVTTSPDAHAREHALEVQLPFLQWTLGAFEIVPLVVGHATPRAVAEVLEALWGGPDTLIILSSDLSHYLPYAFAQRVDRLTCAAIAGLEPLAGAEQACGATPLNGLLLAARRHGLRPRLLDLRNSGDTAGDRERVVGYAAFAFEEGGADDA